jgi:hypothetical protein
MAGTVRESPAHGLDGAERRAMHEFVLGDIENYTGDHVAMAKPIEMAPAVQMLARLNRELR